MEKIGCLQKMKKYEDYIRKEKGQKNQNMPTQALSASFRAGDCTASVASEDEMLISLVLQHPPVLLVNRFGYGNELESLRDVSP